MTGPACTLLFGVARSITVPQAWHSPQRPTHFAASHPHSLQWYGAGVTFAFTMARTYVLTPTG